MHTPRLQQNFKFMIKKDGVAPNIKKSWLALVVRNCDRTTTSSLVAHKIIKIVIVDLFDKYQNIRWHEGINVGHYSGR
jgi:hypothetical protein